MNPGPNVNSCWRERDPALSADGSKLYFAAYDRPGGYGGWEIWVSNWDSLAGGWGLAQNLGSNIDSSGTAVEPFVTVDGEKLYFRSSNHLVVSTWTGTEWGPPQDLGWNINSTGSEGEPSLTGDGVTLYFIRWVALEPMSKPYIYVSHWTGADWEVGELLDKVVNDTADASTAAWGPHIMPDGKTLYFTSARQSPGWQGGGDIWVSRRRY